MVRVQIAYATETGTAQALAEKLFVRLKAQLQDYNRNGDHTQEIVTCCSVADMNDDWIEETSADAGNELFVVVFVVATSGEGDVTNSMKKLWTKLLRANLPKDLLAESARCAIFGLGDSSYEKFNAAARKFRARLLQLGAVEFVPTAAGDEQVDIELAFDKWCQTLEQTLRAASSKAFRTAEQVAENVKLPPLAKHKLTWGVEIVGPAEDPRRGKDVTVVVNRRMTAMEWNQDVRHIEVLCTEKYQAGDVLNIWPKNDSKTVDAFLRSKYPTLDPHAAFICEPRLLHVPRQTTPHQLLSLYLDMNGVPTRFFFQQAAFFCSEPEEREKMMEMASSDAENAASYITYCKRERRTYVEVLQDFPSCALPFEYLLELVPPLRSRAFSICSSPSVHGDRVQITVALLQYLTPWKRNKIGTCSAYLRDLDAGNTESVRAYITEGTLRLPADHRAPLVLIGTGTGCAPMRSLMYERIEHTSQFGAKHVRFYFGCRHAESDFLYKDEWPLICDSVHVAFSKQEGKRVPMLLARDDTVLYDLLVNQHGYCYISGSAKRMPADVRETFVQLFGRVGAITREDAVKLMRVMEKERRYIVEAWS